MNRRHFLHTTAALTVTLGHSAEPFRTRQWQRDPLNPIREATSTDGITCERGAPGENLSLPPGKAAWEKQMTEYPNVVREGDKLRFFYCGNGYGKTGIGTAVAAVIE